jgi:hypothetical protein
VRRGSSNVDESEAGFKVESRSGQQEKDFASPRRRRADRLIKFSSFRRELLEASSE